MATLTVLKFKTATGAEEGLRKVEDLQKQQLIKLVDAAWVTWPEGKKKPRTRQLVNMAGLGALDGAFWGMLFGLIFFVPFFGLAVGAAMGALSGKFSDVGIDDDFIKQVRDEVTEGTSALFLYTTDAVMDRVAAAFKGTDFEIVATNLSQDQEQALKDALAHEDMAS